MEDKILMEEMLSNTGWTSADAERIFPLRIRPTMCGSAFTGAHRHHHLDHLVHLVVLLEQAISATDDKMLMEEMLNDTSWCSTGVLRTESLQMFRKMYGSTDRCS